MGATRTLSSAVAELFSQPLPADVAHEAKRSLLNVCGTAVGAAGSDAVGHVLTAARRAGAPPTTPVPGRAERTDPWHAAVATGLAAHYDDFDDTHLETVIHPGAACIAAALTTGHQAGGDGAAVLAAFALGCETQLRIGAAMSPSHYDLGWHITGTCGVFGAAATSGLLLGLDDSQLAGALGVAGQMTLGVRDAFGTMGKPFHPGKAAVNGMLAALAVRNGARGPKRILERAGGVWDVLAPERDPDRVEMGWGTTWELLANTYKPYPCGIVSHPAIDAGERLHPRMPDDVEQVEVRCHPLVVDLTGNPAPTTGLEARFSTIHGVAAALLDGAVGLPQYNDERVRAPDMVALRARVRLVVDAGMARDAAEVDVYLADGRRLHERVDHARGSRARPLSDEELQEKVHRLVEPVLPGHTRALVAAVEDLDAASSLDDLVSAVTPGAERAP